MILFDGLYSGISVMLSALSLYASKFISKSDYNRFPFGKVMIEPLVILVKSLALFILCVYALLGSVMELLSGGNSVNYNSALIYAFISTIGCTVVYLYISVKGKKISSDIIKLEGSQWLMDALLSAAVLVGFLLVFIIEKTSFSYINKYIDPLMVLMASGIFLTQPLKTIISSFKEVLNVKADNEISEELNKVVKKIEDEYNFENSIARVVKIGRSLRVEVDFILNSRSKLKSFEEIDILREEINNAVKSSEYEVWLNVSITGDEKWAV
ncbi:cation diffusion facilitator family transporter [Clostridium polynesiense]|uniref:cation diffusion facilitator family transporter n=1 Tax=Clostridium polynesiense TaxID=1325933 RepID=UPI00058B7528|nr:cation transporter [Clostridium polynesiense]